MKKILIADDEPEILELAKFHLSREGYQVSYVDAGDKVLSALDRVQPDLLILDLMLPHIDGLEICRHLRADKKWKSLPVIMLTAKSEDSDIILGLEMGADDYITKPFSPKVLVARVRAQFRKTKKKEEEPSTLTLHDIVIDNSKHEVCVGNEVITLTYTEFEILKLLVNRPGWVFSRTQIVDAIRGDNHAVTDRAVDVQIVSLRKKLKDSGQLIETVRGVGYKIKG